MKSGFDWPMGYIGEDLITGPLKTIYGAQPKTCSTSPKYILTFFCKVLMLRNESMH